MLTKCNIKTKYKYFILVFSLFHSNIFSQNSDPIMNDYFNILKIKGEERYDEAIIKFKQMIKKHPEFNKSYKSLAETYIFLNDLEKGYQYFEQVINENPGNPYAYYGLARLEFQNNELDAALDNLQKCIEIDPNYIDAYSPYGGFTQVYQAKGELDSAIQFFNKLLDSNSENPCVHYALGRTYQKKYNWEKAVKYLQKTVELDSNFALAYHSNISIHQANGNYKDALESSRRLLEISTKQNNWQMQAYALSRFGSVYYFYGDYINALFYYNKAYKLAKNIGEKSREGIVLNNIAIVYAMLGYQHKALDFFKSSLELVRKTGARLMEVGTLYNIGNVYKEINKFEEGIQYYQQSLDLAREREYKYEESLALCGIAETYELQKKFSSSLNNFHKALKIAREIDDIAQEGYVLRALGSLNHKIGEYYSAIQFHQKALEIGKQTNYLQIIWEAHAGLGTAYKKLGEWEKAVQHYSNAIALYDSVRNDLDIESLATNFLEDKYEAFPSIIQLYAKQGNYSDAFFYTEKYKAKILLDILSEGQLHIEELIPDSLRDQFGEIRYEIETTHNKLTKELNKSEKDQQKILQLDQIITDLELRKSNFKDNLSKKYSSYYQLTSADHISLKDIQQRILKSQQALIEYILGPEKSSVFVVLKDSLYYHEIPFSREQIEQSIQNLSPIFAKSGIDEEKFTSTFLNAQLTDFSIAPAFTLYQMLLNPIEKYIQDVTELIIVPDDILFYIPFEMLVSDTSNIETRYDFQHAKFLIEKYMISYSNSASLLNPDLLMQRNPQKDFLGIGNPDFGKFPKDTSSVLSNEYAQLPNSEKEVESIAKLVKGKQNKTYTKKQAEETRIKKEAKDFRILHFATHFVANDQQSIYSKLVLSKDEKNLNDGFLYTYEVFNLPLNAELAVLSACNTALGKLSKGEGFIGISRAFLYAGVPSLVLSLWSVEDESTSEIMTNFYSNLNDRMNKNQALRMAKLDFINQNRENEQCDPFYWAPFILVGNTNPIEFGEAESSISKYILLIFLLFVFVLGLFFLRRRFHK